MPLALSIDITDMGWTAQVPNIEALADECVRATLTAADPSILASPQLAEIGLLLADDTTLRTLNKQFRGFDKPTNVLSFPAARSSVLVTGMPRPIGDIAISLQTVIAEAARDGKIVVSHTRHMIVHGVLHLLGHDHIEDADAETMETLEIAILAGFSIDDPYIEHETRFSVRR